MENTSNPSGTSVRERAYYRRRQQNRVFAEIAKLFAEQAERGEISKKLLAERLGRDPAQITRWLSNPSNLELDTISDILLAMGAEMDHRAVRFEDRPTANYEHQLSDRSSWAAPKPDFGPGAIRLRTKTETTRISHLNFES